MNAPHISIHVPGAPQKTCGNCNLTADDDGFRVKRFGGKVFLCPACRPAPRGGR